jgi:organic radical activating enzyme
MNKIAKYDCVESLKKKGDPVIIVSLVEEAEAVLNACNDAGIVVSAFCDNESRKTKKPFCGLKVVHTPDLKKHFPNARFVIAHHNIKDCSRQLDELGYSEIYSSLELLKNYEVSKYKHRVTQYYMTSKILVSRATHDLYFDDSKTFLRSIDVMITTKCSMNCKNCANLMQYYVDAKNTDDKIIEAVELLSKNVDYIGEFRVIGGEPLMNKNWANIINNIIAKNSDRRVLVYTNGTVCPKDEDLKTFKDKNVNFYITDYGKLSKNVNLMEESLKKHGIGYMRKPADNWVDCSNVKQHKRSASSLKQVFKECCAKKFYTLLNGKLYTCPFIANAANLKAIPDNKADYVDLFSNSDDLKKKIRRLINMENFFPACDFCDGRPNDPTTALEYAGDGLIKAGEQTDRKIHYREYI